MGADVRMRAALPAVEADVTVIGAGIIGLCVAHQMLRTTDLSVVLVERQQPCAGATGAGQGYIWMAHRDPASPSWALAARSKAAWEALVAGSPALAAATEFQATGSLLLATTQDEVAALGARAALLQAQGVAGVQLLAGGELARQEPALQLPAGSAGLAVASDAQINGRQTAFALLEECRRLGGSSGRFRALMGEGVERLEAGAGGEAGMRVLTRSHRVSSRCATVLAAGAWSGQLLAAATGKPGWDALLQPRRGHLLELPRPAGMPPIQRGMMELSYTSHCAAAGDAAHAPPPPPAAAAAAAAGGGDAAAGSGQAGAPAAADITFTATTSAYGSLLIGSSREFSGWGTQPSASIVAAILQRAAHFLPGLGKVAALAASHDQAAISDGSQGSGGSGAGGEGLSARVGLRPFAVGGLPLVGPVEGAPGLLLAAGHEGSGLCLGPATADLVLAYALGGGGAGSGPAADAACARALLPDVRRAAAVAG